MSTKRAERVMKPDKPNYERWYYLDEHNNPQPVTNYDQMRLVHEDDRRFMLRDKVADAEVSTVFLGLDHGLMRGGPPVLYETMVFGGKMDQDCERYETREEATAGHKSMCSKVRASAFGEDYMNQYRDELNKAKTSG